MVDTDYITKESALSCFHDWIDRYGHEHSADEMTEYQRIEDLPVADVRPVVRGEWVYEEPNGANNFKGCYWCDQCHQPINHKKNFCPNCGADMREGTK